MHRHRMAIRYAETASLAAQGASILRARGGLAVLASAYIVLLLWNYGTVLAPLFEYYGLIYEPPTSGFAAFTFACAILPVSWLPIRQWRPSMILCYCLYLMVYVPACIVPAYNASIPLDTAAQLQLSLLAAFGFFCLSYAAPLGRIHRVALSQSHFWGGVILYCVIVMLLIYVLFGFSLKIHSFDDVYEVRGAHQDVAGQQNRLAIYLLVWQANVIAPLLFTSGWVSRRWSLLLAGAFIEIWLFSRTGYKHFLLAIPFLTAVLLALRGLQARAIAKRLCGGFACMVALSSALDWLMGGFAMSSLVVRRGIITPGLLTYYYFDYFSHHPKALLGHSILGGLFGSPDTIAPPFLIAQEYFHHVGASANANIWADGFANFGLFGMCAASFLLAAFCWLYDSASQDLDRRVSTALLAVPAIALSNSALLTAFLSHGLGLALAVALFMPSQRGKHALPGRSALLGAKRTIQRAAMGSSRSARCKHAS